MPQGTDTPTEANTTTGQVQSPVGGFSVASQVMVLLCGTLSASLLTFVSTRLYAQRYSVNEVSAVLLFRLMGIFLTALASLGMPISLLRNISLQRHSQVKSNATISVGLLMGLVFFTVGCGTAVLLSGLATRVVEVPTAPSLWSAYATFTFFQGLVALVGVVWLATGHPVRSVLLTFSANGLAQIVPLLLLPKASVTVVLWATAGLAALCAVPFFLFVLASHWHAEIRLWKIESGVLTQFGASRVPGIIMESLGDLTIPWLALASGAGLKMAGFLAVGMALMRPMNPLTSALNNVLVPATARLMASKDESAQKRQADLIGEWSLHLGLLGSILLAVWCDVIIRIWLGPGFRPAVPSVRVIAFAVLPVFTFAALRGIVEALTHRPLNTISLITTYLVMLAGAFAFHALGYGGYSLPAAYLISRVVLAGMTLFFLHRLLGTTLASKTMIWAILASGIILALNLGYRVWLGPGIPSWHLAIGLVGSAAFYLVAMSAAGAFWARYLTGRARSLLVRSAGVR